MSEGRVVRQWRHPGQQWREIEVDSEADPLAVGELVARKRAEGSLSADLDLIVEVGIDGVVYTYRFQTRRTIEVVLV